MVGVVEVTTGATSNPLATDLLVAFKNAKAS
jgi:hypothetical protein